MSSVHLDFTDVLTECLEAIEQDQAMLEACLARYPEHATALQELLPVMMTLRNAPAVAPTPAFRRHARQRLLTRISSLPNENVTFFEFLRHVWQSIGSFELTRRVQKMTWILLIATVVTLVAGGGAVYVADAAVPGDALYGLDISIENVRLNLASTPEKTARLQLAFATERLQEAQKLMDAGDVDHYQVALSAYGDSISGAAQTLGTAVGADQETLANLLEEALAVHDTVLGTFVTGPNGAVNNGDGDGEVDLSRCENMIDHPIAQAIADQYEVPVEEVMALFCNGAGFGEIMLAYSISEDTGIPVSDLFALRDAGLGWGQIMQNVGLIGRPDDVPQGPPDDVPQGPPDDVPQGPPDDVPQGPPDDVPQGPPDDVPQGPPDDVPQGPPDDVPQGPPDDVPQGPPDDAPQGPPDDAPQGPPENSGPPAGTGGGRP